MAIYLLGRPALSQGVPPDPLDSGLVLSLDFNGNILDTSGAGNSPLPAVVPFTNNPAGDPFSAAHFDGLSQFLLVKDSPSLHTPYMTVAFWMRTDAYQTMQMAVKARYGDSFGEQWSIYYDTIYFRSSLVYAIKRNGNGRGTGWYSLPLAGVPVTNQWMHVAGTWDGTNQNLYVDGKLAARKTDTP
ncbi:MAG TPA: LamG-like jellyroll fold domain-containing protein, partial [Candidatus Limnocylindria bacterium]|nr:LamG-like jellyroll fold domain-containing protein [Candidatus Limnocylindria bacterium]